jgi:glycosyltransferase involved in cell wall biosynthesis
VLDTNIPIDLLGAALDFLPLYHWLLKNPRSILYAHNRPNAILGALMHRILGVPVLVHVHTLGRKKVLNRLVWRMAEATVIFNSKLSCLHFDRAIESAHIHTPTIRWPKRSAPGEGRLVACSAVQPIKNTHLIIEAFYAAGKAAPRTLHIYGISPEPLDQAYQDRIIELAKKDRRIHLHDWDARWSEELGYNDRFIHASRLESFGIVMLEAFARGCTLIVPQGTFLDDLPQEGIFSTELTTASLVRSLERAAAYASPSNLWESRRVFERQFSIEETCKQLQSLLSSITNGNPLFRDAKEPSHKSL